MRDWKFLTSQAIFADGETFWHTRVGRFGGTCFLGGWHSLVGQNGALEIEKVFQIILKLFRFCGVYISSRKEEVGPNGKTGCKGIQRSPDCLPEFLVWRFDIIQDWHGLERTLALPIGGSKGLQQIA